jgi:hypothetical protein
MTLTEILIVLATIAGPISAVQAQKWLERAGEARRRRMQVFSQLMATRATRLANEHVQALNMIELVFLGRRARRVVGAWRIYADHLNVHVGDTEAQITSWATTREELFFDLMQAMSDSLGFKFDRVQLRRGVYYPKGHVDNEAAQRLIQEGLVGVLTGNQPLTMKVIEFPASQELIDAQIKMMNRSATAYREDGPLRIAIEEEPPRRGKRAPPGEQ